MRDKNLRRGRKSLTRGSPVPVRGLLLKMCPAKGVWTCPIERSTRSIGISRKSWTDCLPRLRKLSQSYAYSGKDSGRYAGRRCTFAEDHDADRPTAELKKQLAALRITSRRWLENESTWFSTRVAAEESPTTAKGHDRNQRSHGRGPGHEQGQGPNRSPGRHPRSVAISTRYEPALKQR